MANKNYNPASPYKNMANDVYEKYSYINKPSCPTATELDWNNRVVNLV